jgi:hypothetical protein
VQEKTSVMGKAVVVQLGMKAKKRRWLKSGSDESSWSVSR